jgi:hypothetical protein
LFNDVARAALRPLVRLQGVAGVVVLTPLLISVALSDG